MGEMNAGQVEAEEVVPRPRRRGAEEGRIVTNVPTSLGLYIAAQADDLGISPSTYARMMIVECVKNRGLTLKDLEQQYPAKKLASDGRTKAARKAKLEAISDDEVATAV